MIYSNPRATTPAKYKAQYATGPSVQQSTVSDKITAKPVSAPSSSGPKKPIKKNSVEYWERAREKTLKAQDKATPGGIVWKKMGDRAADQADMIDHMKATGKKTLEQSDWDANKDAYKKQTVGLSGGTLGGQHTASPATQVPTTASAASAGPDNGSVLADAPGDAKKLFPNALKLAMDKGKPAYVHYEYGYWVDTTFAPSKMNKDLYYTISPDGKIEKVNPQQSSTSTSSYGAAPTTSASNTATGATEITHSEAGKKLGIPSFHINDALDDAIDKNQDQYVSARVSGPSTYVDTTPFPPKTPGTSYVKVTKSGKFFYSDGTDITTAAATTAAASGKPTVAGRGHLPAVDNAAGPKTEFEFDDEDTRKFGLDIMAKDSRDRKAFEGTPEGAAVAGRFIPQDKEVARHYKASGAKPPVGTKTAIGAYQGSGYQAINSALRGKESPSSLTVDRIDALDKAMAAYATKEPMLLSRGVGSFPQENMAGQMIQDPGYMSTAIGGAGGFGGATVMKIYAPAGTHGIPMNGAMGNQSKYPEEREFLLPRGTTILISRDEVIDGTRVVVGTIVPVPQSDKTKSGKVDRPIAGIIDSGYSKEGLEYLRTQGRAKWAKRYAAQGQTLALSRRTWYNRLVRERQRRVILGSRT